MSDLHKLQHIWEEKIMHGDILVQFGRLNIPDHPDVFFRDYVSICDTSARNDNGTFDAAVIAVDNISLTPVYKLMLANLAWLGKELGQVKAFIKYVCDDRGIEGIKL